MRFRDRMIRFMQGRYCTYRPSDELTKFLLVLFIIFTFTSYFAPTYLLSLVLLVYLYFRLFSKNISKRYKENETYLKYRNKVVAFFKRRKYKFDQMRKYHIYKCPDCGQKIRIPRGKGKIMVRCPKCGKEFQKRS